MVLHRVNNLAQSASQFRQLAPSREHQAVLTSILVRIQGPSPIRVHQEDLTSTLARALQVRVLVPRNSGVWRNGRRTSTRNWPKGNQAFQLGRGSNFR